MDISIRDRLDVDILRAATRSLLAARDVQRALRQYAVIAGLTLNRLDEVASLASLVDDDDDLALGRLAAVTAIGALNQAYFEVSDRMDAWTAALKLPDEETGHE